MKALAILALLATGIVHDDTVGARDCLALVVFSEARGESWLGQAAVAQVVVNRARSGDQDVCGVVAAPAQFLGVDRWPYPREPWRIDAAAWAQARAVADAVIEGDFSVSPPACATATHFYAAGSDVPSWAGSMTPVCVIEGHVFLRGE